MVNIYNKKFVCVCVRLNDLSLNLSISMIGADAQRIERVRRPFCERALKAIAAGVYSGALINNLNKLTDEIYSLAVSVSQLRFIYHLLLVRRSRASSLWFRHDALRRATWGEARNFHLQAFSQLAIMKLAWIRLHF